MVELLELAREPEAMLLAFTDGGSDYNIRHWNIILAWLAYFIASCHDLLVVGRTAPQQSWVNPAERIMSVLNLALQNCALARDGMDEEFEKHFKKCNSSMAGVRTLCEKLSQESIRPAAQANPISHPAAAPSAPAAALSGEMDEEDSDDERPLIPLFTSDEDDELMHVRSTCKRSRQTTSEWGSDEDETRDDGEDDDEEPAADEDDDEEPDDEAPDEDEDEQPLSPLVNSDEEEDDSDVDEDDLCGDEDGETAGGGTAAAAPSENEVEDAEFDALEPEAAAPAGEVEGRATAGGGTETAAPSEKEGEDPEFDALEPEEAAPPR